MRRSAIAMVAGLLVVTGALALAAPANAVVPTGKQYTIDFFGLNINAPANLVFVGLDCATFFPGGTACFPASFGDCGPYRITSVEGSVTHFEVDLAFPFVGFLQGPVTLVGTVDRFGAGSGMGASGNGPIRSFGGPPTRTNVSMHAIEGCPVRPEKSAKPADNWIRLR